jgi:hypothetical protein
MYAIFVDLYVILNYNRLHDVYNGMFDSSSSQIIEYLMFFLSAHRKEGPKTDHVQVWRHVFLWSVDYVT